jgi:hypothetical protein
LNEPTIVTLKRGSLYLSRAIYDRYFHGLEGIVLLRREADLLILPVRHAAAGGYFLKLCNSAGDRVVTAPDFFREHRADHEFERRLPVNWVTARAALVAFGAFDLQT